MAGRTGGNPSYLVAFIHPDLGLGGAERLVVDAAVETVQHGHTCHMYTAYYDPNRCFEETKQGLFTVSVAGSWFPRSVAGKLHALCAYIRCLLVALHVVMQYHLQGKRYDVIVVDQVLARPVLPAVVRCHKSGQPILHTQVSVVNPMLRWLTSARVLFYCHFPDMLLAQRSSRLRQLYRAPLDAWEQQTTGMAHGLVVNSRFTAGVFATTFQRLAKRGVTPGVLYPAVPIPAEAELQDAATSWKQELPADLSEFIQGGPTFLSINRFERKKGLELALRALHELLQRQPKSSARLVLAGGYDKRVLENVEVFAEMKQLAQELGLSERVRLMPSFTDRQRRLLLAACTAVVYTPQNEHFGIVPLEAMAAGRPVVACNSGGPVESVKEGSTGMLRDPTPAAFAAAYEELLRAGVAAKLGAQAKVHVQQNFSRQSFGDQLDAHYRMLVEGAR